MAGTISITEEELLNAAPKLREVVGKQTVLVQKNGQTVAAIVSPSEYESMQEARGSRAIAAMERLGKHMASVATPEELAELETALDRKAP